MNDLTPGQTAALERFARAVEASPHNLVSRQALAELRTRHLAESVAFARSLPPGPARVLDLGSGGGFPGFVIAVVRPDLRVELLDSTRKKVSFLREVAQELDVDLPVHHGRAEQLSQGPLGGAFDLVTARAVASLDRLVLLALPYLRPGGQLRAIKGERWAEELAVAAPLLERAGGAVVAVPDDATSPVRPPAPRVVSIARTDPRK